MSLSLELIIELTNREARTKSTHYLRQPVFTVVAFIFAHFVTSFQSLILYDITDKNGFFCYISIISLIN